MNNASSIILCDCVTHILLPRLFVRLTCIIHKGNMLFRFTTSVWATLAVARMIWRKTLKGQPLRFPKIKYNEEDCVE